MGKTDLVAGEPESLREHGATSMPRSILQCNGWRGSMSVAENQIALFLLTNQSRAELSPSGTA